MTMYVILTASQLTPIGIDASLARACKERGIRYHRLIVEETVLDELQTMEIAAGSLLYRASTSTKAAAIELMLTIAHPRKFTTIYYPQAYQHPSKDLYGLSVQLQPGLPVIPTIVLDPTWQSMEADEVSRRLQKLDGFPVVVKTLGLSHGRGVAKADNPKQFHDLLNEPLLEQCKVITRKYLADYRHYRLIVVGGEAVAAIEYHKPADDFRTNATESPTVSAVAMTALPPGAEDIATRATALRSSLLGGVDLLHDLTSGKVYLAEVNVPCYFPRAEEPTGVDIAGRIVDALIEKQEQNHGQ